MNIGGYDTNAFSESDGNRILGDILERSKKIKVHFAEGDKTPNFDGCFELCEYSQTKMIPIGKFNVQIKTMSKDYRNSNQKENRSDYKYSCETKVFNSVIKGISCDPAILFLVDITDRIVFYIHVSPEFALGLNLTDEEHKTIYFNETDRLVDESFYAQLHKIYEGHKRKVYSERESTMTVSEELDSKTVGELQDIIDNFNNIFSNELDFIRQHFYPNVWKFGIAYVKHDETSATIGIYKVQKGENGKLIRKFSKEEIEDFETISYFKLSKKSTKEIINDVMFGIIDDYFDKAYIDPSYLSKNILEEVSFYFLDTIAKHCEVYSRSNQYAVYYKDVVSVEEIRHLWSALIEYSIESSPYLSLNPCSQEIKVIKMDPFDSLHSGFDIERRRKLFESLVHNPTGKRPKDFILILEGDFSYRLVQRVIREIERRSITSIKRVWAPPDYDRFFKEMEQAHISGLDRHETGYVLADFSSNIQRLLSILPNEYLQVSRSLLGKYSAGIELDSEYIIHVEQTHEARCTLIELPSSEFILTRIDKLEENESDDIREIISNLYPGYVCITKTYLCDAFSKPYPLYRNVSYLIKKSIYRYFKRDLPYSSRFHPIVQ